MSRVGTSAGALAQAQGAAFEGKVIQLAGLLQYRVAHHRAAKTEKGWRTPIQGPGSKGFLDTVLARYRRDGGARVIIAELKSSDTAPLTPDQRVWLDLWRQAGYEAYVWRPKHLHNGEIEAVLRNDPPQRGGGAAA